jgi:hypothetical protein
LVAIACSAFAQPQPPNIKAQGEAMKKLAFLVGTWTGDATTVRPNQKIKVRQTEDVSYKLDGLVLLIEGTGRNPESGEVMFREDPLALGTRMWRTRISPRLWWVYDLVTGSGAAGRSGPAKALVRSAARVFSPRETVAHARCLVAEAEIARQPGYYAGSGNSRQSLIGL